MKIQKITALAIAAVLSATLLLGSCGKNAGGGSDADTTSKETHSDYDENGKIIVVDFDNPLADAKTGKFRNIYDADGQAHDNSFAVPRIDVELDGAIDLSDKIMSDFNDRCGVYFSGLEDLSGENVRSDGTPFCMTVDYSCSVAFDIVAIIVRYRTEIIGDEPCVRTTYMVYYYDGLADTEITSFDYINYCGSSVAMIEQKTSEQIEDFTHEALFYPVMVGERKFDIYYITSSGSGHDEDSVVVTIEVDEETLAPIE